jgi:hypothetical protein
MPHLNLPLKEITLEHNTPSYIMDGLIELH